MAVGDVLIHDSLRNAAKRKDGTYDFRPFFEVVAPIIKLADLAVANLESQVAGASRGFSGYPNFNAPDELVHALKDAGFDAVTVSNNHSLDRGWEGLADSLKTVDKAGLAYIGAYSSPEDKAARLVSVHNGVRVAMLAYTYGLNGRAHPPKEEDWKLGTIDLDLIFKDMAAARAQGVDFMVVSLHFGEEYWRKPSPFQRDVVEKLLAGGPEPGQGPPDVILGHHPHVVQPFVMVPPAPDGSPGLAVIWSLGNFISGQVRPWTNIGLILDILLTLEPDGRKVVGPVRLIPTFCHKGVKDGARSIQVIPLDMAAERPGDFGVSKSLADRLSREFKETAAHLVSMSPPVRRMEAKAAPMEAQGAPTEAPGASVEAQGGPMEAQGR